MRGVIFILETVFSRKGLEPNDWVSIFDKKTTVIGILGITLQREYES
jgi:hypothetical protein